MKFIKFELLIQIVSTAFVQATPKPLASGMDIFPTVVELSGGEIPANLDGKSLTSNLIELHWLCH